MLPWVPALGLTPKAGMTVTGADLQVDARNTLLPA
jgi:hypothetical protein